MIIATICMALNLINDSTCSLSIKSEDENSMIFVGKDCN